MIEITIIAVVTTSFAFWLPYFVQSICYFSIDSPNKSLVQYNCPTSYFNPFATLLMNTQNTVVANLINSYSFEFVGINILNSSMIGVFGVFWFFFAMITYGSAVPSGVFLPAMLVGCSLGLIYENLRI